jgi:hypothetical protein
MRRYNRKSRDNIFLNMKKSLILKSLSNFSAPSIVREQELGLGQPLKGRLVLIHLRSRW